jgi:hypothetical protein
MNQSFAMFENLFSAWSYETKLTKIVYLYSSEKIIFLEFSRNFKFAIRRNLLITILILIRKPAIFKGASTQGLIIFIVQGRISEDFLIPIAFNWTVDPQASRLVVSSYYLQIVLMVGVIPMRGHYFLIIIRQHLYSNDANFMYSLQLGKITMHYY